MRRFFHRPGQTPPRLASSAPYYIDPSLFNISPPRKFRRGTLVAAALCLTVLLAVALISATRSAPSDNLPVDTTRAEEITGGQQSPDESTVPDPAETTSEPTDTTEDVVMRTDLPQETTHEPPEDSTAPVDTPPPPGAYAITPDDMSDTGRGPSALTGQTAALPSALPTVTFSANPVVLLVHSAPTQGYSDGTPWYDPTTGPLGVVSANAPDGITALGAELCVKLRSCGIETIHLTVPTSNGGSESAYAAVDSLVREYCRLYPRIALVLDLRRTAEMTAGGDVMRTQGEYQGSITAQLRISVSRDRDETALRRDLTVALALRQALWGIEPTISRPVHLRSGSGLGGSDAAMNGVPVLTLDLGSAGNTAEEARRLLSPLALALATLLSPL